MKDLCSRENECIARMMTIMEWTCHPSSHTSALETVESGDSWRNAKSVALVGDGTFNDGYRDPAFAHFNPHDACFLRVKAPAWHWFYTFMRTQRLIPICPPSSASPTWLVRWTINQCIILSGHAHSVECINHVARVVQSLVAPSCLDLGSLNVLLVSPSNNA